MSTNNGKGADISQSLNQETVVWYDLNKKNGLVQLSAEERELALDFSAEV
jgi:hypothetical protein